MIKEVRIKKVRMKNSSDFDIVVRDARGVEHFLFPGDEKKIERFILKDKGGKKCL